MSVPLIRSPRRVQETIAKAEAVAAEHHVPLTVERLAACLGMSREDLLQYVHAEPAVLTPSEVRVRRLLKEAYYRIGAELAEELMKNGSHTGAVFLSKNNFGYADKADLRADLNIAFTGESELPD